MVKVAATLVAAGLMPLAITSFQLSSNADALFEQLHRTHMVALASAAGQMDAYLGSIDGLGQELAEQGARESPRGEAFQGLLGSILRTRPEIAFIGVYDSQGETVVQAQRRDLRDELTPLALGTLALGTLAAQAAEMVAGESAEPEAPHWRHGRDHRWIVWPRSLPERTGNLILVASGENLATMTAHQELGEQAEILLLDRALEPMLAQGEIELDLPDEVAAAIRARQLTSGSSKLRKNDAGDTWLMGYKRLALAPWTLVSRQPSGAAEVARGRMRKATTLAVVGALALAAVLSGLAYRSVVLPIRRILRQQRELAGTAAAADGGNEIEALEDAFRLLERRLRDSEGLGKVFLGRYQVVELIGGGGMGRVFRGWDTKLQRPVALKTIRLENRRDSARLVRCLLNEAEIIASFRHANIVTLYDVTEDDSAAFLAMEMVEGISLERLLAHRRRMTVDDVVCLGVAVSSALDVAHGHGLVHQDVKPANILLGRDGSIKVADFGIAQYITVAMANEGEAICGTPGYLPPETFEGKGYGPAGDIFGLGVVFYQALSGGRPFEGRSTHEVLVKTMADPAIPIVEWVPDLPESLAHLVMSMLEKAPEKRPTAVTVREQLEQIMLDRRLILRGIPIPDHITPLQAAGARTTENLTSQILELPRQPLARSTPAN